MAIKTLLPLAAAAAALAAAPTTASARHIPPLDCYATDASPCLYWCEALKPGSDFLYPCGVDRLPPIVTESRPT